MQTTRSACRSRFRRAPRPPLIALVVPYRPQAEQDRAAQLAAFLEHTARFLSASAAARFVVIVAQQSDDGRKFNRGALLNAGFREAQSLYRLAASLIAGAFFLQILIVQMLRRAVFIDCTSITQNYFDDSPMQMLRRAESVERSSTDSHLDDRPV